MKAEQQILQHHHNDKHLIKRLLHACIQESLLPFAVKDNALSIPLIRSQKTIVVENVQCYALRKFKLKGEVNLTGKNDQQALENMPQLLNLIHQELESIIDIKKWKQFITEINNCIANDSLVSTSLRAATNQLLENIKKSKHQRLIEYISTHYSTEKQLQFFETWAVNGHPYHPCHKTKLGFNKEAYLKFSPEFNEDIHLPIGAIAKSLMHVESEENDFIYTEWFAQNFPTQWQQWIQAMLEHKLNEAYYYPIFIHPWQYENVLKKLFSDHVHTKKIILFSNITLTTKASLSFRTLISQENPQQPHIKLPVAVQSTSALRTVSPASVQNGPRLGKILRQILLAENHFNHTLKFSYELYGLHINEKTDIAKNLSVIYRQNPATLVQEKQLPMVVAALFVESPVSKLPIFIELIQAATDNSLAAVQAYFDEYSKIVINAFLDLYLVYGIALEGHQQNTIAVFENYRPVYMIARDLGGTKLDLDLLKTHQYFLETYPNSAIIAKDHSETTNNFLHTVMQYHLGEIVLLLSDHYQISENIFWKLIKKNIVHRFEILRERVSPARWEHEKNAILVKDWKIKNLMRMRLHDTCYDYIYTDIHNPLRDIE